MTNDTKRAIEIIEPMAKELKIEVSADDRLLYCNGQAIGISCNSTYATINEFLGYAFLRMCDREYPRRKIWMRCPKENLRMIDRKKVINGIEHCDFGVSGTCYEKECPYYQSHDCTDELKNDILTLLKEQEAVEQIYNEEKYLDHLPHCGNCEKVLPNNAVYGKVNFCYYCGRLVNQE